MANLSLSTPDDVMPNVPVVDATSATRRLHPDNGLTLIGSADLCTTLTTLTRLYPALAA